MEEEEEGGEGEDGFLQMGLAQMWSGGGSVSSAGGGVGVDSCWGGI